MTIKEKLPEKGKDIVGVDKEGKEHYVFRCNCSNKDCAEWRCSTTGFGLIVNIVRWRYVKEHKTK